MFFYILILSSLLHCVTCTPLDDYVWKDDGYYKYEVLRDYTYRAPGVTSYMLNMTSQRWLTDADVSRSIWWHYLIIHIPDVIDPELKSSGLLFHDGDDNSDEPPPSTDPFVELFRLVAVSSKSVTAVLKQIPNCKIRFGKDPEHRLMSENAILAYSWKLFNDDPSRPELLVTLPMSKAGVKAMDTVTDFVNKTTGMYIKNYCVSGASKRGWAAWTTAAVDNKRVKCLAPVVYDYLNFAENMHHHYEAYGGWTFALKDFYGFNLTKTLDDDSTKIMASITDPLAYKDRLTMPKMIISSTGDEYFILDDSHYYFNQMEGTTYVNMLPNAEHTCLGHEMQLTANIEAFYISVMKGLKTPKISWVMANTALGGIIDVTVDTKPVLIRAWHATTLSNKRRDFRLMIANTSNPTGDPVLQPIVWVSSEVTRMNDYSYKFEMENPQHGWQAFFIQMTFPGPGGRYFECTTETKVLPSGFPFPECYKDGCYGKLV